MYNFKIKRKCCGFLVNFSAIYTISSDRETEGKRNSLVPLL